MPITTSSTLVKLSIDSFYDIDRKLLVGSLAVMFNPESLSTTHESLIDANATIGKDTSPGDFMSQRPIHVTMKLVFDGTDVGRDSAAPGRRDVKVSDAVERVLALCFRVQGKSHQPPYLRLRWGTGVFGKKGFKCRLTQVNTTYTLFDRDGTPLCAELDVTFVEAMKDMERLAELRLSSPDLTHHRVVRSGDTLPAMCREIYGSPVHYMRVAAVNGLDDLRSLKPGQELVFPPYATKEPR